MDEGQDFRKWDELIPDALGLIFKNLSLVEILTVVPRVCKSWGRAVSGPYCWQEIDLLEWSRTCKPEIVEQMVQLLVSRSLGSLRKFSVSGLACDESLFLIANHAQSLQTLHLPRSHMDDSVMVRAVATLTTITSLDLSYCINIGAQTLEAVGKHCKSLTTLRRVMHPLEVIDKLSQDNEALAIAATMPRLKHLEIAYMLVCKSSVVEILDKCKELELLDVRGCWNVSIDEKYAERFPKLKVIGPHIVDCYDMDGCWDNYSYNSDSSGDLPWDFVADDVDDDYEMGYNDDMRYDLWDEGLPNEDEWPQSP